MARTEVRSDISSNSKGATNWPDHLMPSGLDVSVRVIRTIDEIQSIRTVWADKCVNPDADPDLFLLSSESECTVIRPHVIVVFRNGVPDCILVGRIEAGPQ